MGTVSEINEGPTVGKTKILTTPEALAEFMSSTMEVWATLGAMIEHFGPRMKMLCDTLSPEEAMEPCLGAFWKLLGKTADKIQSGEWS